MPGPVAPAELQPVLDGFDGPDRPKPRDEPHSGSVRLRAAPGDPSAQVLDQRGDDLGAQAGCGRVEPVRRPEPSSVTVTVSSSSCSSRLRTARTVTTPPVRASPCLIAL